jgi:hypothetical protein
MAGQEVKYIISADPSKFNAGVNLTQSKLKELAGATATLTSQIKSHWMGISAAVYASYASMQKAWNLAEMAAQFEEQQAGLQGLASQYGMTADAVTRMAKEAVQGQLSLVDSSKLASKALMLGFDPQHMVKFLTAAERLTDVAGGEIPEAFQAMEKAAVTGRSRGLVQYGLVVDLSKALEDYANKHGIAKDAIDAHTATQIRANVILEEAKRVTDRLGESEMSTADRMNVLRATVADLQLMLGQGLIRAGAGTVGIFQSISAASMAASTGIWKLLEAEAQLRAWMNEKVGATSWAASWRKQADEYKANAQADWQASLGYAGKSQDMFSTMFASTGDLAKAMARPLSGESTDYVDKKAQQLQERWAETKRKLEGDISTAGLDDFEKKLTDIDVEAAKLKEEFKSIAGAGATIGEWAEAQKMDAAHKAAEKDFEEYLKKQDEGYKALRDLEKELTGNTTSELQKRMNAIDAAAKQQEDLTDKALANGAIGLPQYAEYYKQIREYRKKQTTDTLADNAKALRESTINERVGVLDLGEATGTMRHADTLSERVSLTKELIAEQENYFNQMDRTKDVSAWNSQLEKVNALRKSLAELAREQMMQSPFGAAKLALKDYADYAADTGPKIYDAIKNAFDGLTDTLVDFCMTGKASFKDLANSIIKDLLRIAIQQNITGPMASGMSSLIGLGLSVAGSMFGSSSGGTNVSATVYGEAMGDAFYGGRPLAFASGGIVTSPTYFRMANGAGLMGEAGPEAVMPLKRTRSGKLGVAMDGGGGNSITINVPVSADVGSKKMIADLRGEIEKTTRKVIERHL